MEWKSFQIHICVALESKMTGKNLCQFDVIADINSRANKKLSIAKFKTSRVIAYALKPWGKKSLSVCSTSWSVLRWNMMKVAAQMQLHFIHMVPSQPRLKRLSRNTEPDHCSGRWCKVEEACRSLILTDDLSKWIFWPKPGATATTHPAFCLSLLLQRIDRLCSCTCFQYSY